MTRGNTTDAGASITAARVTRNCAGREATRIKKPLLLHIAEGDDYVPPPAQEQIRQGLSSNPLVTIHSYPNVGHAFARIGGKHYDKAIADLANVRSQTFFRQHLS